MCFSIHMSLCLSVILYKGVVIFMFVFHKVYGEVTPLPRTLGGGGDCTPHRNFQGETKVICQLSQRIKVDGIVSQRCI